MILNFSKSEWMCNVQFSNLDTSFHDLTDNQITMLVDHACKSMCGDDPNSSLGDSILSIFTDLKVM